MILILVLMTLISLSSSVVATNQDLIVATQEMQNANYFTFVLLLNMAPNSTFQQNITFLMPNDRALSQVDMHETSVVDFLLRHSIPSPLLIDHLEHFPTGSMIPASSPGFMFKVTNDGRRRFFLGNVRITSPNICTKGSSIRCHGIDGVLQPTMVALPSPPPCSRPPVVAVAPSPPPPRPDGGAAQAPAVIPAPSPSVVKVSPPTSVGHAVVVDLVTTFSMVVVLVKLLSS
ncbi:hypothetical protein ACS0TY_010586 [Phlomoides rotata]